MKRAVEKAIEQAEEAAYWAKKDLVDAREFAKASGPEEQRLARQMARTAKRRHSKANRKAGRMICRSYE